MIGNRTAASAVLAAMMLGLLNACVSEQVVRANAAPATRIGQPIAEKHLLDVGIAIFDPGLTTDRKNGKEPPPSPAVRKAEARFIPYTLKTTLEATGQWGAVQLLADTGSIVDVTVSGRIVKSNGSELVLDIEVWDARGHSWLSGQYSAVASKYAYSDRHFSDADPFQKVYNDIANDMLTARAELADRTLESIRTVAELRFAAYLSPQAFADYLRETPGESYVLNRLPAADDPMLDRVRRIRERDSMLMDTLDAHYAVFYRDMQPAYREWRKTSYEETVELNRLRRSARNRMGMGAAAAIAGVAGGVKSDSSAGQIVSTATAVGGAAVFMSGLEKYEQSQIHAEALEELNESFAADLAPRVVEIEGRTVTLTGSAETQFREWRSLLEKIYRAETGLPPENPPATPGNGN